MAHQAGVPNKPETLKTIIEQCSNLVRAGSDSGRSVLQTCEIQQKAEGVE